MQNTDDAKYPDGCRDQGLVVRDYCNLSSRVALALDRHLCDATWVLGPDRFFIQLQPSLRPISLRTKLNDQMCDF